MSSARLAAAHAWLPQGWEEAVDIGIVEGRFARVRPGEADGDAVPLGHWVLPGMVNLHSHAFQRAMAGLAERRSPGAAAREDSFWTWREVMYAFAGRIGPDELRAIAAQLYVEMLEAGYTQVCEFHYLHHRPDGTAYADAAAMSLALVEAAQEAGIGLTLLPTLYLTGGFDGRALSERQRRFGHRLDAYLDLVRRLQGMETSTLRVGVALHSLRAVPPEALTAVMGSGLVDDAPIHIHIAEQLGEVQDCLALRGARPVDWLLDHAPVDARWTLVHATHLSEGEVRRLADSGAVAGLCPTTEANLGDGLFPFVDYLAAKGKLGIGSDSNVGVSPAEELRWLEYGQRLRSGERLIGTRRQAQGTGEALWRDAALASASVTGRAAGELAIGQHADLCVLDMEDPALAGHPLPSLLDRFVFAADRRAIRDVMTGGRWVIRDGQHRHQRAVFAAYRRALRRLQARH